MSGPAHTVHDRAIIRSTCGHETQFGSNGMRLSTIGGGLLTGVNWANDLLNVMPCFGETARQAA